MPRGRPPKSKQTEAEQSEPDAEMEVEPDPAQNAAATDEPTSKFLSKINFKICSEDHRNLTMMMQRWGLDFANCGDLLKSKFCQ